MIDYTYAMSAFRARKTGGTVSVLALTLAAVATAPFADAQLTGKNGYNYQAAYTLTGAGAITAFGWGSDNKLYYSGTDYSGPSSFFRRVDSGGEVTLSTVNSSYGGAGFGLVSTSGGDFVYFNDSGANAPWPQYVRMHEIGTGTASLASSASNYSVHADESVQPDRLFAVWGSFGSPSSIGFADVGANGTFGGTFTGFGSVAGNSGFMTFDNAGNLYYGPGGGSGIYRWTAADVAAAIADPVNSALTGTGNLYYDWSGAYASNASVSGMVIGADGNLYFGLNDFFGGGSHYLLQLTVGATPGLTELVESASANFGNVRAHQGEIYFTDGSQVLELVPEPSTYALFAGFAVCVAAVLRRRIRRS